MKPANNGIGPVAPGALLVAMAAAALAAGPAPVDEVYSYAPGTRDGTGKFYMGREISQVLGHRGAAWLDRPEREREERPERLLDGIGLRETDVVADVGAGSGYLTFRLARRVPRGRVLAVDIQPEMLERIERRKAELDIERVEGALGTETDTRLPAGSIDVALLVDAYHEFSHPREMMESIVAALRPDGRVILVEYRGEDPDVPIKPLHKMTVDQTRRELEAVGLVWRETRDFLPRQHVMIFDKRSPPRDEGR